MVSQSTVIAIVCLIVAVGLIVYAVWYLDNRAKSGDPYNLTAVPTGTDGVKWLYTFTWQDTNPTGTEYDVGLYTASGSKVITGSVTTSQTVDRSWAPTEGVVDGSYTFKVMAKAPRMKSSNVSTQSFSVGGSPVGPGGTKAELFAISKADGKYFSQLSEPATALAAGEKSCALLGARMATQKDLESAFTKGASNCSYGVAVARPGGGEGIGGVYYGFPSYNAGGGCYVDEGSRPQLVRLHNPSKAVIFCHGAKPDAGTKVSVFDTDDGVVSSNFSDNLNGGSMWSMYDPITKPPKYGCSNPDQACTKPGTPDDEVFMVSPNPTDQDTPAYIFNGSNDVSVVNSMLCTETSDCPSGMGCYRLGGSEGHCVMGDQSSGESTMDNMADKVCKSLGATQATSDQVTQDFKQGASWCSYGFAKDSSGTTVYGYPSWNTAKGCGLSSSETPRIVPGAYTTGNNILCYGVKPDKGTTVDLNKPGDKLGVVSGQWSDNMSLYSKFDDWGGVFKYCSSLNQPCTG